MIAEVLITPDVFAASEEVLRNRLADLSATLLPQRITPRFVICQLDSQKWQRAVGAKLVSIRSHELQSNARAMFMHLIDKEHGVCVILTDFNESRNVFGEIDRCRFSLCIMALAASL